MHVTSRNPPVSRNTTAPTRDRIISPFQPWVFTDSLLFGFFAELDGSDKITVQEDELAEANWYLREELPEDTTHISLTAEMIEQFRLGRV